MKNALMAALVLFLALPQVTSAQAKPDFSGTWTFDEAKSDPAPARAGGGGRSGGRGGAAWAALQQPHLVSLQFRIGWRGLLACHHRVNERAQRL